MTKHQLTAYRTLLDTGDNLRAMLGNARSQSHPLNLDQATIEAIVTAQNALYQAQRTMDN